FRIISCSSLNRNSIDDRPHHVFSRRTPGPKGAAGPGFPTPPAEDRRHPPPTLRPGDGFPFVIGFSPLPDTGIHQCRLLFLSTAPQQLSGDDEPLDLVGSLVDLGDLGVPEEPFHRILPGITV